MQPFGILADDLTGACDSGVQFSARGALVRVVLDVAQDIAQAALPPGGTDWALTVVNTESRHLAPEAAADRVSEGLRMLAQCGAPLRYKKIDSTLRGNLAAELAPLMAEGRTLVVCPAFPRVGRTVEEGRLLVNGVAVHETALGRDPLNPVRDSHVPTLLLGITDNRTVPVIPACGDPSEADRALDAVSGQGLVVADAATEAHLTALAAAMVRRGDALVGVGSAGLAGALAHELLPTPAPVPAPPRPETGGGPRPVLVVAGSRHPSTRAQVAYADQRAGAGLFACRPEDFDQAMEEGERNAYIRQAVTALAEQAGAGARLMVLTIAELSGADGEKEPAADIVRLRSERLNSMMGEIALAVSRHVPLAGLVLTGGDTARSVLHAFQVAMLQLGTELEPGIPLGWTLGPAAHGLPVVTKAGGFGEEGTLVALAGKIAG